MSNEKRKGIWIPAEIIEDEKLDWTNKALFSDILSLHNLDKGCFASNEYFSILLGLNKSSASKRISQLAQIGYITTENKYNNNGCVGRIIKPTAKIDSWVVLKRNSSSEKDFQETHEVVPEQQEGSSSEKGDSSLEKGDSSLEKGDSSLEKEGSSQKNTTNTVTNSYTSTDINTNIGPEEKFQKSQLGETIFPYNNGEKIINKVIPTNVPEISGTNILNEIDIPTAVPDLSDSRNQIENNSSTVVPEIGTETERDNKDIPTSEDSNIGPNYGTLGENLTEKQRKVLKIFEKSIEMELIPKECILNYDYNTTLIVLNDFFNDYPIWKQDLFEMGVESFLNKIKRRYGKDVDQFICDLVTAYRLIRN